ncbi:MAG: response regulator [Bdellovibrionota bacterium]|nr:response regulator [Bdellovibrionota bacterium]
MLPETMNKKAKVLIVDDSQVVLSFHKAMLEQNGYETECAINGFEALERFSTEKFDLIITDVNMPKMDGYQFTEEVRKQDAEIPIIMVTTESQPHDREKGLDAGVDLFLVKPLKLDILKESLEDLVA